MPIYHPHLLGSLLCTLAHLGAGAVGCTRVLAALPTLFVLHELPMCARKKMKREPWFCQGQVWGRQGGADPTDSACPPRHRTAWCTC